MENINCWLLIFIVVFMITIQALFNRTVIEVYKSNENATCLKKANSKYLF